MIAFIYGEDNFRSAEKLNQLKDEFFKKNTSNASSSVFDFSEEDYWPKLRAALKSKGLFAQNSLIVIKNLLGQESLSSKDEIMDFLENQFKSTDYAEDFIIFWEGGKIKKNNKIFKWLTKNSKSQEFNKLEGLLLKKWVEEKFLSFNIKVGGEVSDNLINNKNGDLSAIDNEILKIVNFIGEKEIEGDLSDQVAKLVNSSVEANIFQTVELISSGNKKQALEMLHRQLEQGDDPFYILSMYIYQIRNLLKIAEFHFQGNLSHLDISRIVKLHPFVVQKGIQQLRNLNFNKLKEIYKKLEKIDEDAKRGKRDIGIGMELLIAEI